MLSCLWGTPPAPLLAETPEKIIVGGGNSFRPLIFEGPGGRAEGADADLWRLWSEKTGVEVELRLMDWALAIPALREGEVDVVDGVTRTPEREAYLDFTEPYAEVTSYIYFHESLAGIRDVEDLAGFPVGVIKGTNLEAYLREAVPEARLVPYANHEEIVKAATSGGLRVFVGEEPIVPFFLAMAGKQAEFRRNRRPLLTSTLSMAVRKGETELLALVERGLAAITPEERERIRSAWAGVRLGRPFPWHWVGGIAVAVGVGLLLLLVWNAMLRWKVAEATRTLRASEEKFSTAFMLGPDDVLITRQSDGKLIEANEQFFETTGYQPETALGRTTGDLGLWLDLADRDEMARKVREEGGVRNMEVHLRHGDGSVAPYLISARPIALNNEPCIISIMRNIADRKRAEEEHRRLESQLRHSQKMEAVGLLAGGIAHDFNNLLQVIQGYTDLTLAALEDSHPVRPDLGEVRKAAKRAASLTQQLLTFSRQGPLRPELLDLNAVISDLVDMLRRVIGEHIELSVETSPDLKRVYADPGQIQQVLMNLCLNARDAMAEGGRLTIATCNAAAPAVPNHHVQLDASEFVRIRVADTGKGIPLEIRERIFEPFFTTKEVGQGTGLGLATVYAIVEQHGGWLEFSSRPGEGTEFRIFLPVSRRPPALATNREEEGRPRGKGEMILLAEDDAAVRDLAVTILNQAGYRLLVASDGEEAMALLEKHAEEIALAVLDVIMPRKGGMDVFRAARRIRPDMPVLFSSGYYHNGSASGSIPADSRLIQKPYRPGELLRAVRDAIEEEIPT